MDSRNEQEHDFLRASLLGDIREDIQFAGFTMIDLLWIILGTILLNVISFFSSINVILKLLLLIFSFAGMVMFRFYRIPYRFKRWTRYKKEVKHGTGEVIADVLGVEADGPFFRSGKEWQMVFRLSVPPWETAVLSTKRKRILSFEQFIRTGILYKVNIAISWDEVPDYQWDIWNAKRERVSASPGIERMKQNRLAYFQKLADQKHAMRTQYYMRLSVNETDLTLQENDDDLTGLTKDQIKRKRIIQTLSELMSTMTSILEGSGHRCTLISGYAVAESLAWQWDPIAWHKWKGSQGKWDDDSEEEIPRLLEETDVEPSKAVDNARKKGSLILLVKQKFIKLFQLIHKRIQHWRYRKNNRDLKNKKKLEEVVESAQNVVSIPALILEPEADLLNERVIILTSPDGCGKTFLACNLAVANASVDSPVTLIDLSVNRGLVTYLNPILLESGGMWDSYKSRLVPGLTLLCLSHQGKRKLILDELQSLINQINERIIIDLPWQYPWWNEINQFGRSIAVVDSDYHHWLQWEAVDEWHEDIWLNQSEIDMSTVINERWNKPITRRFPSYKEARMSLYRGRPLALDKNIALDFALGKEGLHAKEGAKNR